MNYNKVEFEERYYLGKSIKMIPGKGSNLIPELWQSFMREMNEGLKGIELNHHYIGLELYPHDYLETHEFIYHAMVQSKEKTEVKGYDSIVLPAGTYILFEIEFDDIINEIQKVYKYIKENHIDVSYAFDYEDYLMEQNYAEKGAVLNFGFLLRS